jgi:hypothetical protein
MGDRCKKLLGAALLLLDESYDYFEVVDALGITDEEYDDAMEAMDE